MLVAVWELADRSALYVVRVTSGTTDIPRQHKEVGFTTVLFVAVVQSSESLKYALYGRSVHLYSMTDLSVQAHALLSLAL